MLSSTLKAYPFPALALSHCSSTYRFPEWCPFCTGTSSAPLFRELPNPENHTNTPLTPHTSLPLINTSYPNQPEPCRDYNNTGDLSAYSSMPVRDVEGHTPGIHSVPHVWGKQLLSIET